MVFASLMVVLFCSFMVFASLVIFFLPSKGVASLVVFCAGIPLVFVGCVRWNTPFKVGAGDGVPFVVRMDAFGACVASLLIITNFVVDVLVLSFVATPCFVGPWTRPF